MCGLFGFATHTPIPRARQILIQLAMYNENRGNQSWGFYDGEKITKDTGSIGRELWRLPDYDVGLFLGHTRAPTVGALTQPNAHPFRFGDVIGAHNGSVSNYDEMNKKYEINLEVDSMHIFHHIANGLPMKELEAHGAVTYVNNGRLWFCRFNGGSLSIAKIEGGGLVWSSEEAALTKTLDSAGIKDYTTYKVVEDMLFFWGDDDVLYGSGKKIGIDESRKRVMGYTIPDHEWNGYPHQFNQPYSNKKKEVEWATRPFVRLRIGGSEALLTEEEKKIEEIKLEIFGNEALSKCRSFTSDCVKCKQPTTRRLLDKDPTCLTCMAKMVLNGEISVSSMDEKEDTVHSKAATMIPWEGEWDQ